MAARCSTLNIIYVCRVFDLLT
uniref:Uncharacterized protein n=2 Tax=Lepeophtheirus salmonis TaxID=72036 RepID=A0A0K2UPN9_LEPSM